METIAQQVQKTSAGFMVPIQLLEHWLGHRSVTRKTIEAFPEEALFQYSLGGMRTFAELVMEMIGMGVPVVKGAQTGIWPSYESESKPTTKEQLLGLWDDATAQIKALFSQIPAERFQERDIAFGQWEGPVYGTVMYAIDNEIHHRAQGTVYLRSLNIAPPFFWERN